MLLHVLLRKLTLLHDQFHGRSLHENSDWRHGFTAAWKSGGAAGATHVQISWISAWIPSEVTRTFFSIFPYGIQIQVHFHVGHFLAKWNQQLLVPLDYEYIYMKGENIGYITSQQMETVHKNRRQKSPTQLINLMSNCVQY